MKHLSKQEVISQLSQTNALENGFLKRSVDAGLGFYEFTIENPETLFNLIWHYRWSSAILTPGRWYGGKLYTVKNVAKNLMENDYTFDGLVNRDYAGKYEPGWFRSCAKIDKDFSWKSFNSLVVQLPTNVERIDCPNGNFRLIDGVHRSLVATVKLLKNEIEFEPIKTILIIQKPPKLWG